ncbi:amidase [Ferrovibrio sp.]|uniref:amidase n=1 Tax=Ferrovibrio sp. TaxID=1917215 RepID=UPI001B456D1D|nr:amidase [Ferrovibrio sp.]MBP7065030.1 amidase [Ferrovibrio sp.]
MATTYLGATSPVNGGAALQQTAAALERIADDRAGINAFVHVDGAAALAAAAKLDAEGDASLPLFGLPVGVKDILNVAGMPTRWGSRSMAQAAPAAKDTIAVARLRAAGAVIVGKTSTTEFAHAMMGYSAAHGLTRNPWNPAVTCGGSSAGAGAAVAAGQVPLALATDAGASTRLPAACCGVVGLKPTLGRIPHDLVPEGFANFIHLGLIAREVEIIAQALDALSGPLDADPHSIGLPAPAAMAALGQPMDWQGKRLLVILKAGNQHLAEDVRVATMQAVEAFKALGMQVSLHDGEIENAEPVWRILQQSNWAARFAAQFKELENVLEPSLVAGIREGLGYSGLELQRALYRRTEIFRRTQALFAGADFILTPVGSRGPLPADHPVLAPIAVDGVEVGDMRREWTPYLSWFDLTGHPAISLPCGTDHAGAPLGVQLVAPWYAEAPLLALAKAYQGRKPWPVWTVS